MRNLFFDFGFRPFFFMAGLFSLLLVLNWILFYNGYPVNGLFIYYGSYQWHGHEMIFGYTIAVIAGFLLTAVRNWTGLETAKGYGLFALALLWMLGRVLPLFPVPSLLVAVVDLIFLPCLALVIGIPIAKSKNYRNLFFIPIFIVFILANITVHLEALGMIETGGRTALRVSFALVIVIITIIGGRVIPFFSGSAIEGYIPRASKLNEKVSVLSAILFGLCYSFYPEATMTLTIVASLAAVSNLVRLITWYDKRIWNDPLLWVLHVSYAWMIIGYVLFALGDAISFVGQPALHGLTIGTIGGITLGMMVRVSLGHTGRPLIASRMIVIAFLAINCSALVRVFLPSLFPEFYIETISLSGAFWVLAFSLFLIQCAPMLFSPRVDSTS